MKNMIYRIVLITLMVLFTSIKVHAQFVVTEVIKITVTKVIKAIDLKVQRLQNKTIWLQNAQKVLENELAKFKLTEISGWSAHQQQLYAGYYDELWKVKSTISYYQRIKDLTVQQVRLIGQYRHCWALLQQDRHFNIAELSHMQAVYSGILKSSADNLEQVLTVIDSYRTQMTDEQRLYLINIAGNRLNENYDDLRQYNQQNIMLSLQRSKDLNDTKSIKQLYGIN